MTSPEQFTGYAAFEQQHDVFNLKAHTYIPRPFTEKDVDVRILASGICGSDVHILRSGWSQSKYPAIVGHEIVGEVVRAGSDSGHQLGDMVAFGAQCDSCGSCETCKNQLENYCRKKWTATYQGSLGKGAYTQGGYADYYRGPGRFAIKFPKGLDPVTHCSLLCGGVTVYAPLKAYGAGPGKRVGVVGIGGLGHLGLQFSKALGAETYALTHSASKEKDALALGAKKVIVTKDQKAVLAEYAGFFDIIICTSFQPNMPLSSFYLPLLKPRGNFILNGLPEEDLPPMKPQSILGKSLTGSLIGSPAEIEEMFEVAVKHGVKPWVTTYPMDKAGEAVTAMHEGKARYRFVLVPK
ncbi:hypothetical protein FFLO_04477 [Filobasidium floriforme]|uniref:Enoyl reductase (ER) domain-containing protein n=1 Tax=Filobasidium floriforme TaxID=5210 RepID=A0A8K0NS91_9TREE|nr:hypothetical protein FFLO_04477 [Filobasidium floriforme]